MKTKTLRKMPAMILSRRYSILFGADDTARTMLRKGNYTYADGFPHKNFMPPAQRRANLEVVGFGTPISPTDAAAVLKELGKLPVSFEHLLAVGYQYPTILDEILKHFRDLISLSHREALSPEVADQVVTAETIMKDSRVSIVSIGPSIGTCVVDLYVFPVLTNNKVFGAGKNLIGYHANQNRILEPGHFFLVMDQRREETKTPFLRN